MFENKIDNKEMLEGAYKKLKSYYYYNKNFIVMKEKISKFESDEVRMDKTFVDIAEFLKNPEDKHLQYYLKELFNQIDFYVLPKKFVSTDTESNLPVSNIVYRDKKMKSVNFFINLPIELYIIDSLWTLLISNRLHKNNGISDACYGNTILESVVTGNSSKHDIDFNNNRMFNSYFPKYTMWRNKAFDSLGNNYDHGKDSVLLSLDLQAYFYSVKFNFEDFNCRNEFVEFDVITKIMQKIYQKYKALLINYKRNMDYLSADEYPLPIGLLSSMVIGNAYLLEFDNKVLKTSGITYYGRYVDDMLLVFETENMDGKTNEEIIEELLINTGLFLKDDNNLVINGFQSLIVQNEKVKIIYINNNESKSIIDVYNNSIRVYPSQIDAVPNYDITLTSFDEKAYNIENFTKDSKLRDIGQLNLDTHKINSYFSSLIMKYAHINSFDRINNETTLEINDSIKQIEHFFTRSQCLEFYQNWMNYMYFLIITQRKNELNKFYGKVKNLIDKLDFCDIDILSYKYKNRLSCRVKKYLLAHLEICYISAWCLDLTSVNKRSLIKSANYFIKANMFNHTLVAFPLANYLNYGETPVSYLRMDLKDIAQYEIMEENFKFKWTPRFIHYDEIQLLLFYYNHINQNNGKNNQYATNKMVQKFSQVNGIPYGENYPFKVGYDVSENILFPSSQQMNYRLRKISVPQVQKKHPEMLTIAAASLKIKEESIRIKKNARWRNITLKYKSKINDIFLEMIKYNKESIPTVLVFPELSIPIYWINDVIRFAKRTQIAVIAGLQYLCGDDKRVYNYVVTILPFKTGKAGYRNTFVYIREKNDYSPIEQGELTKLGYYCYDKDVAEYQIFEWKGIRLSAFLCYELTDVVARALIKGKSDIMAVPVYNKDTTYFSNIIDTTVRDLHAFIVQANTSIYGDSRLTAPYDRDHKDVFKIKGGDNNHVMIGSVNFAEYIKYQREYKIKLQKITGSDKVKDRGRRKEGLSVKRKEYSIKPLSARFYNERTDK